ncbi:MAG: Cytochrome bd-I ubiquinol oxidase subunit 2 [Syntrophorhabdus sp. PtaU1.Bin153]|nr:MAG: Cytochrome bd-I ubiquinol oxidase subunit 2 [Syntrophorhabdus sp. PtaU1.Bin153]
MIETVWFILWGVLWAVYFMLDGFDLGLGALTPFVAKNETEKRIVYGTIGPFWDGNEVWLITAGGVTFAAFPGTYAVMFSSLYSPLMLILFALILRGAALEMRNKAVSTAGRKLWDMCLVAGSFAPALLFGVAFANIFRGIPIDGEGLYHGSLPGFLNPYGLLGGLLFLSLFLVHGCLWLAAKSEGDLHKRAARMSKGLWIAALVAAALFLGYSAAETSLYSNYRTMPVLFIIPFLAVCALIAVRVFIGNASWWKAWFASCTTIAGATLFGVVGLYPNLFPSSMGEAYSMTIYNSSSSPLALKIMLVVALIFVPIVITYQVWAYSLFRGKVREQESSEETY